MDYTKTEETVVNRVHFPAIDLNQYEESTNSSESRVNEEISDCGIAKELGLIELLKEDKAYELIFNHCLSNLPPGFQIVSILKNAFQSPLGQAKLKAFQIYIESVAKKNGGWCECGGRKAAAEAARVKYGCCGVEKEELKEILMYGFSHQKKQFRNNNALYFSSNSALLQCMRDDASSSCEEDGIRFLLLSRMIMGKSEVVSATQSCPSSTEFDSGVDSLTSPRKYIIWTTHINTHVLPEFVVCIKSPSILRTKNPKSPWISFPILIKSISKFLNQSQIRLVQKHYREYQDRRISRSELIQRLRSVTGDRLLVNIIKYFGHKASEGSRPINLL